MISKHYQDSLRRALDAYRRSDGAAKHRAHNRHMAAKLSRYWKSACVQEAVLYRQRLRNGSHAT